MSKTRFRVVMHSKNDPSDMEFVDDEIYKNEEEAKEAAAEASNNFATGAEILALAGEDYIPPSEVEFGIVEV